MERREAEVVEELVAQFQITELRAAYQQQHRFERKIAFAQRSTDRERALRVEVGADDRAGPAVVRLGARRSHLVAARLPRIARQVEGLGKLRGRRVGEQQQRLHQGLKHHMFGR